MSNRKIAIATAVVAAAGLSTVARADDTTAELDALKARIAEIESQQHQAAISATVADTEARNDLLRASGFTAGWDDGFKLGSGDGKYSMQIYGLLQVRNITTSNGGFFFQDDDDDTVTEEQTINGFEIARTQLGVMGTIIDPRLGYNIRAGTGHSGGGDLQLAYMTWKTSDEWAIKAGQYFANWTQERNLGDGHVMAVDRSLLASTLGGDVTGLEQGVAAMYDNGDNMRAEFGLTDGAASGGTPWNGEEPTGYDYGVNGRFEYKFNGDWSSYNDFTALGNKNDLCVLGGGFDWSLGSDNAGGDGFDFRHTVDFQWENTGGLAFYVGYVANFRDDGDDTYYDWGAMGQVAYLFGDSKWEVFGRYSYMDFDIEGDEDTLQEITGGVNYYFFNSHAFKFTCDLNWLPDGSSDYDYLGYVADDDEVWSLRAQLQIEI